MSAGRRPGRRGAMGALWAALRRERRPGSPGTSALFRAVPRMVAATLSGDYDGLTKQRLGLMALAVAYIASPVDLIPEAALLLVGLADDAAVLAWLSGALLSETEAFVAWEKAGRARGGDRAHQRTGAREPAGGASRGTRGDDGPDVVPGEVIR